MLFVGSLMTLTSVQYRDAFYTPRQLTDLLYIYYGANHHNV